MPSPDPAEAVAQAKRERAPVRLPPPLRWEDLEDWASSREYPRLGAKRSEPRSRRFVISIQ